jgi:hypothetical protein
VPEPTVFAAQKLSAAGGPLGAPAPELEVGAAGVEARRDLAADAAEVAVDRGGAADPDEHRGAALGADADAAEPRRPGGRTRRSKVLLSASAV